MPKIVCFRKVIIVTLVSLLIASACLRIRNPVFAEEPKWVLKETPSQQFLCTEGIYCVNPSADIVPGSAKMSFGLETECAAVYSINVAWPDLPEIVKPGESQDTLLSINVTQNVPCPAAIAEKADASFMFGKAMTSETPGSFSNAGYAEVTSFPTLGQSKSAESTVVWTAPEGESGEFMHVRVAAGLKSGLGGYVTYVYEYQDGGIKKSDSALKKDNMADDVCAIGLKNKVSVFPSFVKIVSARDSGARFADFSGEVTVAPGSDPKNTQAAELDMVIETGAIINTEAESTAIISFADMTTFCMKPFTTVIIDTPPEKESKLSLLAGKVWMNVKKMVQDGSIDVALNQAVAGIKGTVLVLEENGQDSIVKVVDGTVEYTAKKDNIKVMVTKGEMISAGVNGLTPKENYDIDAERNNWQEFTSIANQRNLTFFWWILGIVAFFILIGAGVIVIKKVRKFT